jgi:hypothetical protein
MFSGSRAVGYVAGLTLDKNPGATSPSNAQTRPTPASKGFRWLWLDKRSTSTLAYVSKSEAITPLSVTDRNCDALTGLAPRGWRKALVVMQVPHTKIGRKTICRSDDWLAVISRQAGVGPLVAPEANVTARPPQPPAAKSQVGADDEWMRRALLSLADDDRRRRERAAREAAAAIVAPDTLLIENFETNGLRLNTLQKWIRQGRLASQKVGRTVKVARSDVAPLLAEWKRTVR